MADLQLDVLAAERFLWDGGGTGDKAPRTREMAPARPTSSSSIGLSA